MSEEQTTVVEPEVVEKVSEEPKVEEQEAAQEEPMQIEVDGQTAFQMKLMEFDKNIATAKTQVATLEQQKIEFIYNHNVQMLTKQHQEKLIKQQVEQETKKKLEGKK